VVEEAVGPKLDALVLIPIVCVGVHAIEMFLRVMDLLCISGWHCCTMYAFQP
jgi:hypothetical protein